MLLSYISASHEMSSRNRYFHFHLMCGVWSRKKIALGNRRNKFQQIISCSYITRSFWVPLNQLCGWGLFRDPKILTFFLYQTSLSGLCHHKSESAVETVNVMIDSHFATAALEIWLRVLQYATDKSLCTFLEKNHSAPHCSINATNNSFDFDGILFYFATQQSIC